LSKGSSPPILSFLFMHPSAAHHACAAAGGAVASEVNAAFSRYVAGLREAMCMRPSDLVRPSEYRDDAPDRPYYLDIYNDVLWKTVRTFRCGVQSDIR
jgi:hypothetical protein